MKHYALTLDLKDDPQLIAEYEEHHRAVWPDVLAAIKRVGVVDMKIYRLGNRMFMQMTTIDEYDPEQAQAMLQADPKSVEWERLMDKYQQRLPGSLPGQKWLQMTCCFELSPTLNDQ